MFRYYKKQFQWTDETIQQIDWNLCGHAMKKMQGKQLFVLKLGLNKLPIGD
jgi:hypothetical protein